MAAWVLVSCLSFGGNLISNRKFLPLQRLNVVQNDVQLGTRTLTMKWCFYDDSGTEKKLQAFVSNEMHQSYIEIFTFEETWTLACKELTDLL